MDTPQNRTVDLVAANKLARQLRALHARWSASNTVWMVSDVDEEEQLIRQFMKVAPPRRVLSLVKAEHIPKAHGAYGSPIVLAAELGLFDLIKPLYELGCSPDEPNSDENTALTEALCHSHLDPTARTVTNLLDIEAEMDDSHSILSYAAFTSEAHAVRALLRRGFDPNCDGGPSLYGNTPLLAALRAAAESPQRRSSIVAVLTELLEAGADPNAFSRGMDRNAKPAAEILPVQQLTTIKNLSRSEASSILATLVSHRMQINHGHPHLHHPLTLCIREGNDVMALCLMEHGADPTLAHPDTSKKYHVETLARPIVPAIELFAMRGMPLCTNFMIEQCGADPEHALDDGRRLVDAVTDPATREVLRSAITQSRIDLGINEIAASTHRTTNRKKDWTL